MTDEHFGLPRPGTLLKKQESEELRLVISIDSTGVKWCYLLSAKRLIKVGLNNVLWYNSHVQGT